jgi:hypothetical protein
MSNPSLPNHAMDGPDCSVARAGRRRRRPPPKPAAAPMFRTVLIGRSVA